MPLREAATSLQSSQWIPDHPSAEGQASGMTGGDK